MKPGVAVNLVGSGTTTGLFGSLMLTLQSDFELLNAVKPVVFAFGLQKATMSVRFGWVMPQSEPTST